MKVPSALLTAATALHVFLVGMMTSAAPVPGEPYHWDNEDSNKQLLLLGVATTGTGLAVGTIVAEAGSRRTQQQLAKTQAELEQATAENKALLHARIATQQTATKSDAELYQDLVRCWTQKLDAVMYHDGKNADQWVDDLSERMWGICMGEQKISPFAPLYHRAPPAVDVKEIARRVHHSPGWYPQAGVEEDPHRRQSMPFARAGPAAAATAIQHTVARWSRWGHQEMHALVRGAAAFHPDGHDLVDRVRSLFPRDPDVRAGRPDFQPVFKPGSFLAATEILGGPSECGDGQRP
ncbi:MAG: hypothetical protein M1826_004967 [Phylliscum demangeonii]|nr:MAG: hypothetical protein M1826_004967 [Phylliscum demangeonii]